MTVLRETSERVAGVEPDLVTRFRWRAERRCWRLNEQRRVPFYRWVAEPTPAGRWHVVALQNVLDAYSAARDG